MYPHAVAYFHFAPNCDIGLFDLYSLMIESNSIINFYWFHSEKNYAINLPIPIYQLPILLRERGGGLFIWINHEYINSNGKIKNKHACDIYCVFGFLGCLPLLFFWGMPFPHSNHERQLCLSYRKHMTRYDTVNILIIYIPVFLKFQIL